VDGKDNSDAMTDGKDSRKRARVDEETSSPAHSSEPPSSPLSIQESVQMDGHQPGVDSDSGENASSISQVDRSTSYQPRKRNLDSRISKLQEEMTKLQNDLGALQTENSLVRVRNEELEIELKAVREANGKLTGEMDERVGKKRKIVGVSYTPDASKADVLPPDVRNRLEGHANNLVAMIDDLTETSVRLQQAFKTIHDQKRHIATVSCELQKHKEARTRLETEHKEHEKRLQAMNAWLMGAPKFDPDVARIGG